MRVAKQAVEYYCRVTGKAWSDFFLSIDNLKSYSGYNSALTDEANRELWLVSKLISVIEENGLTIPELIGNKDAIKKSFDNDTRKGAGEFYTPEIWCAEGRKYFDKYIPNWRDYNIWDMSCYSMDTEVLTKRSGWVTFDDLSPDDEILTLNPKSYKAEWSGYYNPFKKTHLGTMVSIDNAFISMRVTGDHMIYATDGKKDISISAKEFYNRISRGDKLGIYQTSEIRGITPNKINAMGYLLGMIFSIILNGYKARVLRSCGEFQIFIDNTGELYSQLVNKLASMNIDYTYDTTMLIISDKNVIDIIYNLLFKFYNFPDAVHDITRDALTFYDTVDCRTYRDILSDFTLLQFTSSLYASSGIDIPSLYWGIVSTMENIDPMWFSNYIDFLTHLNSLIDSSNSSVSSLDFGIRFKGIDGAYYDKSKGTFVCNVGINDISISKSVESVWDLTTCNDNHIFYVRRNGKAYFCKNCGTGNLLRTAGLNTDKLFLSTLMQDDIDLLKTMDEYKGATIFQCDFLNDLDYDIANTDFLDKLPPRLKEIIVNDEPLLIYANPPYKAGLAKGTDVGKHMIEIGLGGAAYDIFYQFCWRVMHFVEMYNLKNCNYTFFGPLTFFTGSGANTLLRRFEKCFEFVDGMCISAQEFSDTSEGILWGIGCSLWKSRGGYIPEAKRRDIILERKFIDINGTVSGNGKVLYEPPREKLSDWVAPKDVVFLDSAPLATSFCTFKGSNVGEKKANLSGKIACNALGTLMTGNTLTRSANQSAVLSSPTTIQFVSITKENFWRCVSSFAFRRAIDADWSIAKKEISAPNTEAEGYDIWLDNALVLFLFDWKSMMSSVRDVAWCGTTYDINNNFFYCTPDEVREHCTDEVILADLDKFPLQDTFMFDMIEKSRPNWWDSTQELYNLCREFTLSTFDKRKDNNYASGTDAWNAGFQQIRACVGDDTFKGKLEVVLSRVRKDIVEKSKHFGFVSMNT